MIVQQMIKEKGRWQISRNITERIYITGELELLSPTHLGSGEADGPLDMPLLLDENGKPLLKGTSIAGALRAYLAEFSKQDSKKLFGHADSQSSSQSSLYVEDAISDSSRFELRDGVKINEKTRTAEDKKKYNIQLIQAGIIFPLHFELLVTNNDDSQNKQALSLALKGFQDGLISLGKRKRRGFGKCEVKNWEVTTYDVTTPEGMISWLNCSAESKIDTDICKLLGAPLSIEKKSKWCKLEATFMVASSIMIRSYNNDAKSPDAVHLHSWRKGNDEKPVPVPVVSGTSIAGALRARAIKIGNTIHGENGINSKGYQFAESLFGGSKKEEDKSGNEKNTMTASRIWIEESEIKNPIDLVQSRIKIDRFTGGVYPGALFDEQPVFSNGQNTTITIHIQIEKAKDADVGLLLLILKDLWTEDLPIGGESNIGRGRLIGESATLKYENKEYRFTEKPDGLSVEGGTKETLQTYVNTFVKGENK